MPTEAAAATSAGPDIGGSLPMDAFRRRRERLLERLEGGVAILCAAPELVRSRDTEIPYRQNSDFYYLTGFTEPDAVAVVTPHDPAAPFTLFVRRRDPDREAWNGPRAGVEGARERYGADAAHPIEELDAHLRGVLEPADVVFYSLGSDPEMDRRVIDLLRDFRSSRPRTGKGPTEVRDPAGVLDRMRLVKEPEEIARMRAAAEVAARGHRAVMGAAGPGVGEWELQARLDAEFRSAAPDAGTAFPPIVGSGPNATILHYVANRRRVEEGELVLVDAGAELGMYCSDITRTFPASGRFSPEQRAVYEVVRRALEAAIEVVRPGAPFERIHVAAQRALTEGMVELGLLSGEVDARIEDGSYKRFFMHQTSHWLGLDVHDAGAYRERDGSSVTLEPGMVLTVEPGIYIPVDAADAPEALRGIGIRLEDDVLVTADGHEVLTRGVPVDPDEVERLVGRPE